MSVSYQQIGTVAAGTTSLSVPYPATTTSGRIGVLFVVNRTTTETVSTPTGWTAPADNTYTGGSGAEAADTGSVRITTFYRILDGTEGGTNLTVTITSGAAALGIIVEASRSGGSGWGVTVTGGSDNSGGATSVSVTGAADIDLDAGDLCLVAFGLNTNLYTYGAARAISAAGATFTGGGSAMTEVHDSATGLGNDAALCICYDTVATGPSSGAPTASVTASGSATDNPAGAGLFVRLYETSGASLTDVDTDETILAAQAGIAYTGSGLTNADEMRIYSGTEYASGTSFSATNDTSGTFTAPTFAAIRTAGVKFGTVTFDILDGGVSLGTLAGTLNPEATYTVHNVTDISQAADTGCIYYGWATAAAVGDQVVFTNDGGLITIDSQGFVVFDGASVTTTYYVWDDTDNTWGSAGTFSDTESVAASGTVVSGQFRFGTLMGRM